MELGGATSVRLRFSLQGTDRQGKSVQSQGIPQQSQTGSSKFQVLASDVFQEYMVSFPKQCGHTERALTVRVKGPGCNRGVHRGGSGIFPANCRIKWLL